MLKPKRAAVRQVVGQALARHRFPQRERQALAMWAEGFSPSQIARALRVPRRLALRAIREAGQRAYRLELAEKRDVVRAAENDRVIVRTRTLKDGGEELFDTWASRSSGATSPPMGEDGVVPTLHPALVAADDLMGAWHDVQAELDRDP